VARVLDEADIRYVAVEMNAQTVTTERQRGVSIVYGDACQAAVLEGVGVGAARVIVIAISDPAATRRITRIARSLNSMAEIIVRTRYVEEVEALAVAGASEVVPEEFETSIEIFSRVLRNYMVPSEVIEELIRAVRQDAYVMLRYQDLPGVSLVGNLAGLKTEIVRVERGSPIAGLTLLESRIRSTTGTAVVAIKRGAETISNPTPETRLEPGDVALVLGTADQVMAAAVLFRGERGRS
jgi:CPA2 family monovalent cation:H+ antiporter-2